LGVMTYSIGPRVKAVEVGLVRAQEEIARVTKIKRDIVLKGSRSKAFGWKTLFFEKEKTKG